LGAKGAFQVLFSANIPWRSWAWNPEGIWLELHLGKLAAFLEESEELRWEETQGILGDIESAEIFKLCDTRRKLGELVCPQAKHCQMFNIEQCQG
jgi:hypothetical protein